MKLRDLNWIPAGLALLLGSITCAALLLLLSGGASPGQAAPPPMELHVCPSGCPYNSIQTAVDAADPGAIIKVAAGTYTDTHTRGGVTQVVYLAKTVNIIGGFTTTNWHQPDPIRNVTRIDAGGQGRGLYITGYYDPVISGLHITGGDATGLGGDPWGNDAGGGIYINVTPVTIRSCVIYGNTAYRGGGLFSNAMGMNLLGNLFRENSADWGGGLYLYSGNATVADNLIIANQATTRYGGGLYINGGTPVLVNNVLRDNHVQAVDAAGSGLFIYRAEPRLVHNTVAANTGGLGVGIYIDDTGSQFSSVVMTNTIIYSHVIGLEIEENNSVNLAGTLWYANSVYNWSGAGTISHSNNVFQDPKLAPDGYHLLPGSGAIDAGVAAGLLPDIDGQLRPLGTGYDIGADEYFLYYVQLPLLQR
ncbi:MAG: hypothetical protein JW862_08425 [Anaerolineales bacterium]|nr:hypothetical protein [Anaerolineales bacterium]